MPKIVATPPFTYLGDPKGEELYTSKNKTFHFEEPQ
jgi:hypothetical protein